MFPNRKKNKLHRLKMLSYQGLKNLAIRKKEGKEQGELPLKTLAT